MIEVDRLSKMFPARGDDAANRDIEIAHCELTDSHDGPFIGTIRGLKFHHNLVDNFNDDGIYLTAMSLGGDVHIFQNTISRCLHAFSFFGEYPVGRGVWIYRNVIDLRAPVHYFQPQSPDDERFAAQAAGEVDAVAAELALVGPRLRLGRERRLERGQRDDLVHVETQTRLALAEQLAVLVDEVEAEHGGR